MADLLDGLAQHLAAAALVTYDPVGVSGDTFIEAMPATPDECVVLTLYGASGEQDSRLGYDTPMLQVRVRGTTDPRVSRARAEALYSELHGLGPVTLPDGTDLQLCVAQATPGSIGRDELDRFEHTCNYRLQVRAVTAHRV